MISILFFGATADIVGNREIKFDLTNTSTVDEVLGQLTQSNPNLGKNKLLIAVNEEYASPDTVLNDGDEVAIFTAVSGG